MRRRGAKVEREGGGEPGEGGTVEPENRRTGEKGDGSSEEETETRGPAATRSRLTDSATGRSPTSSSSGTRGGRGEVPAGHADSSGSLLGAVSRSCTSREEDEEEAGNQENRSGPVSSGSGSPSQRAPDQGAESHHVPEEAEQTPADQA